MRRLQAKRMEGLREDCDCFPVHHGAVHCYSIVITNSSIPGPREVGELDMGDGLDKGGRGFYRC